MVDFGWFRPERPYWQLVTERLQARVEETDNVTLIVNKENGRRSHTFYLTRVVLDDKPPNGQD